ncbi:permease, partial [Clostridium sp. cpc1]|nr:permease [Clostridium sp. cpc1]
MITKLLLSVLLVLTSYFLFFFLKDYFKSLKKGNLYDNNFCIVGIICLLLIFFNTL